MDITQLILDDHAQIRRLFAQIDEIDRSEKDTLASLWARLGTFLDTHAEAEERFFYPTLLKIGRGAADADDARDETKDAIKDHNEIRDAVAEVANHKVGSKGWIDAVGKANEVNGDHLAEEERQGLSDFRQNADLDLSHKLALQFARFEADYLTGDGVEASDEDPEEYVKAHEKA
jgi:hemerythrin superfamily protein